MGGPNAALTGASAAGWIARPGGAEAGVVPAETKDLCDAAALIGADARVGNEDAAVAIADAKGGSACA